MKTYIQQTIEETLGDDEIVALADGFERAFVGIARQFNRPFAVYDRAQCINKLVSDGVTLDEAEEWMSYNVEGAWVGENTPAFITMSETETRLRDAETRLLALKLKLGFCQTLLDVIVDYVDPSRAKSKAQKEILEAALEVIPSLETHL